MSVQKLKENMRGSRKKGFRKGRSEGAKYQYVLKNVNIKFMTFIL